MLRRQFSEETSFSLSRKIPAPLEGRQDVRQISILRVGTLIIRGRRELCLMRNISAGGLMAHVYSTLVPEEPVSVEFKTNQQVNGKVVWIRESNIGIAFDSAIDVTELLSNPAVLENGWRARIPRIEIDRMATVRAGARTCWVTVRDISLGGIKAETDQPLAEGSDVVVTLENFRPISGVVRWQHDGVYGITFNEIIPFSELIPWLKQGA